MAFTIVDAIVILVVLISALLAFNRGLTREFLAIGGWIVAGLAAFYFAPMAEPLVTEIPYVGPFLRKSCLIAALASFAVVFALALLIVSIFTPVLSGAVQSTVLRPIDNTLGFLFGVVRGVALVTVLYLIYDLAAPPTERIEALENAATRHLIDEAAALARAYAPTEMPDWLAVRIDSLTGNCASETDTTDAAFLFRAAT